MEKQQYILKVPLKQIVLRKIAVILWHQDDSLSLIKLFRCRSLTCDNIIEQWQKTVENLVKEKVSMLLLPYSFREELINVIKPIGPEILKWRLYHESIISDANFVLDQLFWTSLGKVDYKKTAEILIKKERITIISSYKLACIYCLDDHIQVLWDKLPEDSKKLFYDDENILRIRQPQLVIFWTYVIRGEVAKLDDLMDTYSCEYERTLYQCALKSAAQSGNKAATDYFFQKLTFEEREVSVLKAAQIVVEKRCFDAYNFQYDFPKENFSDVLCYLLSQLGKEEQMQFFKKHPEKVLRCFLDWPWQDLLIEVIGVMWSFLANENYKYVMQILSKNRTMTGYNYLTLFKELFLDAPSHYREYMINEHRTYGFWFRDLINGNHSEIIKSVLKNVSDQDRQKFILCRNGLDLSWKLIEKENWALLGLFVSECKLSSEAKTVLKEDFMNYIAVFLKEGQIKWRRRKWDRFFQLIDSTNPKDDGSTIIEAAGREQPVGNEPQKKRKRRKH